MTILARNVSATHATPAMPSADQRSGGQLVVRTDRSSTSPER
jgi:hypothetical protein